MSSILWSVNLFKSIKYYKCNNLDKGKLSKIMARLNKILWLDYVINYNYITIVNYNCITIV